MKIDPRFKDTEFCIEADDYARHSLWAQFSTQAMHKTELNTIRWEEDSMGLLYQVGTLDKRPVNVTFVWAKLNQHLVLFYNACSQVVDHKMVDNWLKKYCNTQHCDANNFHQVLDYIRKQVINSKVNNAPS